MINCYVFFLANIWVALVWESFIANAVQLFPNIGLILIEITPSAFLLLYCTDVYVCVYKA